MKIRKFLALLLVMVLAIITLLSSCGSSKAENTTTKQTIEATTGEPVELNISAAASLTESLTKIVDLYKKVAPNVTLTFNFGSSGTLQTQIEQGATCDLFLSAASKQMDTLENEGLIVNNSRVDLLKNEVVLIVPSNSTLNIKSFDDCLTSKVSMIAIGDPASVPAGQYAQEVFTYLNGWNTISKKANMGTDVKAVLSWVQSGNVDCGVVYSTDAKTANGIKVVCSAPSGSHDAIVYPVAVVNASTKKSAAQAFIDFLSTKKARDVFKENGFITNS